MVRLELTGKKFNRLTVLSFSHMDDKSQSIWNCICDCGIETKVRGTNLSRGRTFSCGCFVIETAIRLKKTHGKKGTPEYQAWNSMRDRCSNPNNDSYKNYGERGITVCERWNRFENFYADMGDRPSAGYSVGRINNDIGYEPGNCRWETGIQQQNNLRSNRFLEMNGIKRTVSEWCREYNIDRSVVYGRLNRGWSVSSALETPDTRKRML